MEKIDFFGGLHGHFLELFLNIGVFKIDFNINRTMFNHTGACHMMHERYGDEYNPVIKCGHYSFYNIPFDSNDQVVRITCRPEDMLIAVTNSFARTGNQSVIFENLEANTLEKLDLNKTQDLKNLIIRKYGCKDNYPRSAIRELFFAMFNDPSLGHAIYNNFDSTVTDFIEFPFRSFFNKTQFYAQCNRIANFYNLNFYPSRELAQLHNEFLQLNQGLASENRCNKIMAQILNYEDCEIDCNVVEEAWLAFMLCQTHRSYNLDIFDSKNTLAVAHELEQWKSLQRH